MDQRCRFKYPTLLQSGGGAQRQPAAITAEPEQGNRTPAVTAARLQGRSLRGRAQPCEAQPDPMVLLCCHSLQRVIM